VYPKVSGLSHNENNKHSLRSNTNGYGGKTLQTDSQNRDISAPSGRELYHLQFSLQAARAETFGYTLVYSDHKGMGGSIDHPSRALQGYMHIFDPISQVTISIGSLHPTESLSAGYLCRRIPYCAGKTNRAQTFVDLTGIGFP
jgi:hypothetical protein